MGLETSEEDVLTPARPAVDGKIAPDEAVGSTQKAAGLAGNEGSGALEGQQKSGAEHESHESEPQIDNGRDRTADLTRFSDDTLMDETLTQPFASGMQSADSLAAGERTRGLPADPLIRGLSFLMPARFNRPVALLIGISGMLLLAIGLVFIGRYTADPREFPVNEVEVAGTLDYTDRDELRERVVSYTLDGFYALQLDEIRSDVEKMPWVARAHVRRISPDRVSIEVSEHEPAARWNDDGLISKQFELFEPPQLETDHIQRAEWLAYFRQFPQLTGNAGRHREVLSAFRAYQIYLNEFGVAIEALLEDERNSQTLMLENNVALRLGTTRQEERMRSFVDLYERLVPSLKGQPVKFDMRYANGFTMTQSGSFNPRSSFQTDASLRASADLGQSSDTRRQNENVTGAVYPMSDAKQ